MRFKTRLFIILLTAGLAGVLSFLLIDLSALVAILPIPAGTEIPPITPAIRLLSLIQPAMLVALAVLVGHRQRWHVTIRTEGVELFSASTPGTWEALEHLIGPYRGHRIEVIYEAGYFGYWLHDRLAECGVGCVVTPPSLIPREPANRVKTDRRDSRKLAHLLAKGMLKRVWVPSPREREERQVVRRCRQLIQDRVRTQNRVKAGLRFYGIELPEPRGSWRRVYVGNQRRLRLPTRWAQESFMRLLERIGLPR